jgi:transmembrane sensor
MNNQIYEEAAYWLVEFRTGKNDPATRKRFDKWIRKSPEHLRAYLEITEIWQDAPFVGHRADLSVEDLVTDSRTGDNVVSLGTKESGLTQSKTYSVFRTGSWALAAIAASVLLISVAIGSWLYFNRDIYTTSTGAQRSIRLADGSTIELNSQSKVRVRYGENQRNVELLEGQALFHVAKDTARPFIVATDTTQVRAVGTQFDVYRKVSGTTVTVLEGRVAIEPVPHAAGIGHSAPILAAGEQLTIPKLPGQDRQMLLAQKADIETATAWTQNRLIFKSTPLTAVAEEFNRYNRRHIIIRCDNAGLSAEASICDLKISGVYSSTDPRLLVRFLREQPGISVDDTGNEVVVTRAE